MKCLRTFLRILNPKLKNVPKDQLKFVADLSCWLRILSRSSVTPVLCRQIWLTLVFLQSMSSGDEAFTHQFFEKGKIPLTRNTVPEQWWPLQILNWAFFDKTRQRASAVMFIISLFKFIWFITFLFFFRAHRVRLILPYIKVGPVSASECSGSLTLVGDF